MPQGNYLPPFSWLRAFEATARLGSFTHAANDLFITQSAISQHIRNLEMHLNTRLFIRRSRGVELTDMGKAYLPAVQDSFQRLKTRTQDLFGGDDQSVLTVKAGVTFINQCLLPRLQAFRDAYPSIKLRILATVWPDSSMLNEPDIEIEIKHLADSTNSEGMLLTDETWYAMASPTLIEALGTPEPHDLLNWPLIHLFGSQATWLAWFHSAKVEYDEKPKSLGFDVGLLAVAAAAEGLGAVIASIHTAQPELESGRLKILNGPALVDCSNHRIYVSQEAASRPAARFFIEWMKKNIMQEIPKVYTVKK